MAWEIDPHIRKLHFRYYMIITTVKGHFKVISGQVSY